MVTISFSVGSGMGPETRAPVRLAVSTMRSADWIDQVVLIRLELDADFLAGHVFSSYDYRTHGVTGGVILHAARSAQSEACVSRESL